MGVVERMSVVERMGVVERMDVGGVCNEFCDALPNGAATLYPIVVTTLYPTYTAVKSAARTGKMPSLNSINPLPSIRVLYFRHSVFIRSLPFSSIGC